MAAEIRRRNSCPAGSVELFQQISNATNLRLRKATAAQLQHIKANPEKGAHAKVQLSEKHTFRIIPLICNIALFWAAFYASKKLLEY